MNIQPASDEAIFRAAQLIREGKLAAFPTETVYGLGGDATSDAAVAEIFAVKGRPQFNPLIVHVSDNAMAKKIVQWNDRAEALAQAFWPGPLTLVLMRRKDSAVSLLASAGGDTVGVRLPANPVARAVIAAAGVPVAAPSANRSGHVSPTTAQHVYSELGNEVPLILDGGACDVGIESTVVDVSGDVPVLLRPGFITREQLEKTLKQAMATNDTQAGALKSPGMLASHYAPSLPVRLNVVAPHGEEALLAFGRDIPAGAKHTLNLSDTGDLKEAAANLFAALRALDRPEYSAIAVMPVPATGIGVAINDRLQRAAAPR